MMPRAKSSRTIASRTKWLQSPERVTLLGLARCLLSVHPVGRLRRLGL